MSEHPKDLAAFRAALLLGDRRLVRRRRMRNAGRAAAVLSVLLAAIVLIPRAYEGLDPAALAAEAREALERPELVLHTETEVVLPDGRVQQRISRWSRGPLSRTVTVADGRMVEQAADGNVIRVRMQPGGEIQTLRGSATDPLLAFREALAQGESVEEVTIDGVEAFRVRIPHGAAYLRRSDRLPLRVELDGGATWRYRVVEWLDDAPLTLR